MAINDFGQKIGGAKKDLWAARGLQIDDLLEMNEAEKTAHIKKDNVWKKPDYQALVDDGVPVRVVYFMKKMRDATPVHPVLEYGDNTPELITIKQEGYISFVRELSEKVMSLRTEEEVLGFYEDVFKKNYLYKRPGDYYVTATEDTYGCISRNLLSTVQIKGFYGYDKEIKKKRFCYSESAKLEAKKEDFKKDYDIFRFDKKNVEFGTSYTGSLQVSVNLGYGRMYFYPQGEDANVDSWNEGQYFVIKRGHVVAKNLESREAAEKVVDKLFEDSLAKEADKPARSTSGRKTRFTPKQLKGIKRDGPDYRRGLAATGQMYMDTFGFKGGEFGNWMSENDRRASLDFGYDALMDLCKALNISTKDISLGGRLSIAFGSRGSGSAAAHYEHMREVINLTKMRGAGSLAHEWAHALDDIFGKKLGVSKFMTEYTRNSAMPPALKELVDAMHYKTVSDEAVLQRQKEDVERYTKQLRQSIVRLFPSSMSDEQKAEVQRLSDNLINNAKDCHDQFVECVFGGTGNGNKDIDALSAYRKEVCGHGMAKDLRISFAHYQNRLRDKIERVGTATQVETDFYANSKRFDKLHSKTDHGYWQSTIEMFARAFACYVNDKIEGKSDYLVGHSESAVSWATNDKSGELEVIKAIPQGEERMVINRCFDKLIEQLKEKDLLHDYELDREMKVERKPSLMEQIRSSQEKYEPPITEVRGGQLEFEF